MRGFAHPLFVLGSEDGKGSHRHNEEDDMPLKRGCMQLVADARARIKTISVAEAQEMLGKPGIQFVDIRDVRELERA